MYASSFLHISNAELSVGLEYAIRKHGVELNAYRLRQYANETGNRMRSHRESFYIARGTVLIFSLRVDTEDEKLRRDAYSAAIAKIFSGRRPKKKPDAKTAKTPRRRKLKISIDKNGQSGWNF